MVVAATSENDEREEDAEDAAHVVENDAAKSTSRESAANDAAKSTSREAVANENTVAVSHDDNVLGLLGLQPLTPSHKETPATPLLLPAD